LLAAKDECFAYFFYDFYPMHAYQLLMLLSVVVLAVVFLLIAVRQVGSVKLQIWQVMLGGALAVLLMGQISMSSALKSINLDVIIFLFGMFVVGFALEESGYLSRLSYLLFRRAKDKGDILLYVIFGTGIASMFLMNDTLAIIGTPVMLSLAARNGIRAKMLLLALAYSVTVGSAASPIGNPQNLLVGLQVAADGGNPFVSFASHLLLPTALNLLAIYIMLKVAFPGEWGQTKAEIQDVRIMDKRLAALSKASLALLLALVALKIAVAFLGAGWDFKLTYIALAASSPILLFSKRRLDVLRGIDWQTLVFFASMFVLMESVWESGFFQDAIVYLNGGVTPVWTVLAVSVIVSQFISNVPLVALYLPVLQHAGAGLGSLLALAAGSTIAGNLTVLGAASNVIIIQNAERRGGEIITFWDFARVGVPLTLVNVLVYWMFLG
jgi:Na+/H+ antiporter NhaD/arsenite permease-like protein